MYYLLRVGTPDTYGKPTGSSSSCLATTLVQPAEHTSSLPRNERLPSYSGLRPATLADTPEAPPAWQLLPGP